MKIFLLSFKKIDCLPFSELFISAVQFEWTEIKYKTVYNQQTWTEMQEINNFDNFIANICKRVFYFNSRW